MTDAAFPRTDRSTVRRLKDRGHYERALVHAILDEAKVCHVGFVVEGQPYVIPTGYARDGDRLLLHGSVASRMLKVLAAGAPVCVTVTLVDGLVLARSQFHHSMNYRSVVVFGNARPITDEAAKRAALAALVEHLTPGRSRDAREPDRKELNATAVLELPLGEASAKVRGGPPKDDAEDLELDVWAGVVPLRLAMGEPQPAPDLRDGIAAPAYLRRL